MLIFSEDAGKQIEPALRALLRKMFQLVDEQTGTHRVEFLPADEECRQALRSHAGRKPSAHRSRVLLAGKIADQVAKQAPEGFVAYHADADRCWSAQRGLEDFPEFLRLREAVAHRLGAPRRQGAVVEPRRIDRLLLLGPYWELEAWLYQNTLVARALCAGIACGRHSDLFLAWATDRASLDDIKDTKDVCCLRDRYNQELAEGTFPAAETHGAATSFAATVVRLQQCGALVAALQRTHG